MSKRSFLAAIALALILGLGLIAFSGNFLRSDRSLLEAPYQEGDTPEDYAEVKETLQPSQTHVVSAQTSGGSKVESTPVPLEAGAERGEDLYDVLLLYDSAHVRDFDVNFCKVAEYYGLLCRMFDVGTWELWDGTLRDERGEYFELIGVAADILLGSEPFLSNQELGNLKSAIRAGGANLFISNVNDKHNSDVLSDVTERAVVGVLEPRDFSRDWIVSTEAPEITREFTGRTIVADDAEPQGDFALSLGGRSGVTTLLTSTDAEGGTYAVFVRATTGTGSVYVSGGGIRGNVNELSLRAMYYDPSRFSSIVPMMIATRFEFEDEAWHQSHDYANLTIDDPSLTEPFGSLSYTGLLSQMEVHNFHTTIAMHPVTWSMSEPEVIGLFLLNPDRFSLAQHGNNGDGYEFYWYDASADLESEGRILPPRPLVDQEADIIQGVARMEKHQIRTGIPFDRVMIFPWGISPEPTFDVLKKHGFLGTINAQAAPLGATQPAEFDYGMFPAITSYGGFPLLTRRHPGSYSPFRADLQPFIFDLFVDKPALFYSHAYEERELFASGIDAFNPVADEINNLYGEVEWRNLGYILKHLYLERTNDDGSVDVKIFGNHVIITNYSNSETTYHLIKDQPENSPISDLYINAQEFEYRIVEDTLTADVLIPANSTLELIISYDD